jgi:hypothetical protein
VIVARGMLGIDVFFPPLQLRQADMEVRKGQNMIEHEAEIFGRPARTWFQSEKEKKKAQGRSQVVFPFESRSLIAKVENRRK